MDEFRKADGKPQGPWASKNVLLLTYIGHKSGETHTIPLVYFVVDSRMYVMAAKGGYTEDPLWLVSVRARPEVTLTIGTSGQRATVRVLDEPERSAIYELIVDNDTRGAQALTERLFPVLELIGANG
ncbi:MAG TPA: nitroreductase/quinone reductase family protein [Thermomicrobiales bacterium]|nr:nitroreductase/quinone reductase family protein [Thermomicrobiales bacterium]